VLEVSNTMSMPKPTKRTSSCSQDRPCELGTARPGDYTGWLRPDPAGMVIVTTRIRDPGVWGAGVAFRELRPLDEMTAARVLGDLAPDAGDLAGKDAMRLGRRLGGLPLAVHLAGSYLTSPFARWHSFADYHHALDSVEVPVALADLDDPAAQARATIQRTWGLSLDALEANGQPQARAVLFLLSCYAPATPIPASLLQPEKLATLLTADRELPAAELSDQRARQLRDALRGLASAGLIDTGTSQNGRPAVTVHPVVADANRSLMIGTASPFAGAGATAVAALQERC
jgi:hypothetical protein